MAEGIDRKADEKIQFSTSKEVTVHPTFESMSLKGTPGLHLHDQEDNGANRLT